MCLGTPSPTVFILTLLTCLGPAIHLSQAQQIRIEGIFPRQLPRGQATLVNVAIPSRDAIQSVEISPAAGVKTAAIKAGENFQGALTWSELSIDVSPDAATGDRTLVLVLPMGRTIPVTINIPSHVPNISALRIVAAQSSPPMLELEFVAIDASGDLGESPYVWFMIGCGGDLVPGIVHGKMSNGLVRASVPNPHKGQCSLQVRLTDSTGIESNTLRTAVENKN